MWRIYLFLFGRLVLMLKIQQVSVSLLLSSILLCWLPGKLVVQQSFTVCWSGKSVGEWWVPLLDKCLSVLRPCSLCRLLQHWWLEGTFVGCPQQADEGDCQEEIISQSNSVLSLPSQCVNTGFLVLDFNRAVRFSAFGLITKSCHLQD